MLLQICFYGYDEEKMLNRNSKKIDLIDWVRWVLDTLWMIGIFLLSHQRVSESSELSGVITKLIYGLADRVLPQVDIDTRILSFIVRRAAYFTAYLIFGILVMNGLKRQGAAQCTSV